MTCALIEAEEGNFGEVFSAPDVGNLREVILDFYAKEEAQSRKIGALADVEFHRNRCCSLLQMLNDAPIAPGHHILKAIEPHWHEWVLVV